MGAGEAKCQRRNSQRPGVRGHVPSVGNEGHRPVDGATDDLGDHHHRCQRDDEPGPALVLLMLFAKEHMVMLPGFQRFDA